MSKEELKTEENLLFNFIQSEFPEFKKTLKNNFLNLLVKSIASRIYSLKRVSDNYIQQLTNLDDGDLDYRASFYRITRLPAKKSSGTLFFTGSIDAEISKNSYFIDGNYINFLDGKITKLQYNGSIVVSSGVGILTSSNINELPSGCKITIVVNSGTFVDVEIYDSNENGFKIDIAIPDNSYSCNYSVDGCFLSVESVKEGLEFNLEGNLSFNINQILAGINNTAFITPQGLNGGDDIESDARLKIRWDLYRTGYISNFSEDFLKIYLLENFSAISRVFIQRATPTPGSTTIYPLFENRNNILPSVLEMQDIKNKLLEIAPVSVGKPNIIVSPVNKIPKLIRSCISCGNLVFILSKYAFSLSDITFRIVFFNSFFVLGISIIDLNNS